MQATPKNLPAIQPNTEAITKRDNNVKDKIKSLNSVKKVYYFDHRNGVLKNTTRNKYQILSGVMTLALVFGVGNIAVNKIQDIRNNKPVPGVYQRQGAAVDTSKKSSEPSDKLKNAIVKAREDEQLAKQVKSKLKNVPGGQKWSVYVRDLNSERMASVNADNSVESAALGNLFMTTALENKYPVNNWGYKAGKQTVGKCVELMINSADSDCTVAVGKYADLKNANDVTKNLGFKKTTIGDTERKTTARETGDLLFRLQNNQLLSDKARRIVFDGLYGQKQREGIPTGCDEQCLIANVTGESGNVRHDAAIVTSGKARYVVVIMTQGATWSQIADVSATVRQAMQP